MRQNVDAYPGQEAELCPAELMYQLEHPAAKTEPFRSPCMLVVKFSSAFSLISMTAARFAIRVLNKVLVTYSTWTSHVKSAELCAGKVFGPKLYLSVSRKLGMGVSAYRIAKFGKLWTYDPRYA